MGTVCQSCQSVIMADGGYEDKAAWNTRYEGNGNLFEWYAPYDYIKDRVTSATGVNAASKVLIVGCGTSGMSAALFDSGIKNITSIDFSDVAISLQKKRNEDRVGLEFKV